MSMFQDPEKSVLDEVQAALEAGQTYPFFPGVTDLILTDIGPNQRGIDSYALTVVDKAFGTAVLPITETTLLNGEHSVTSDVVGVTSQSDVVAHTLHNLYMSCNYGLRNEFPGFNEDANRLPSLVLSHGSSGNQQPSVNYDDIRVQLFQVLPTELADSVLQLSQFGRAAALSLSYLETAQELHAGYPLIWYTHRLSGEPHEF